MRGVCYLDGASVPPSVNALLKKGLKFTLEQRLPRHQLLATVRDLSTKLPVEEKERCLSEGLNNPMKQSSSHGPSDNVLRPVVRFLVDHNLSILQSDKEGGFAVLPNALFNKKANEAIAKNFKVVNEKPSRVRMKALKLLKRLNLESLAKAVRKSKGDVFSASLR